MQPIGYISDTARDYCTALDKCGSLADLRALTTDYEPVAGDAKDAVDAMTDGDWEAFETARKTERAGRFCGDEAMRKFGAIFMPALLLRVAMVADHFKAPWGCAFIRCKQQEYIVERDGRFLWAVEEV